MSTFEYTKPRGPIAAMYASPGPSYGLPGLVGQRHHDPRSVHFRGPAYPFGIKHGKFRDECSPGPGYFPDPKIYRNGRDGTPHYSLYSRRRDLTSMKTPGPGQYAPERCSRTTFQRAPTYAFGLRGTNRKTDNTPGPNAYTLDPMMQRTTRSGKKQAPCYSMTGRSKVGSFCEDLTHTPGPGAYGTTMPDTYKVKSPGYSMTGRNSMPGDSTRKPGPGAHCPEQVRLYNHKRRTPAFSFGIRHSPYCAPLIVDAI